MQPEQIRHLYQLQRQAAGLGELARELAVAAPLRAEGSDATAWVLIVVGRDGIPTQIRVREGWRQRLEPERLASAVLDASAVAVRRAVQTWSNTLDDGGWWRRRADFEENTDGRVAGEGMPDAPFGHARDSNDVAEAVLRRLHDAQPPQAAPPASVEGHDDDDGHVTIRIAAGGLAACSIDPDWARHSDGVSISAALSTALRRAVAKYPAPPATSEPDTLIGDALATLTSLTAAPADQGGNR